MHALNASPINITVGILLASTIGPVCGAERVVEAEAPVHAKELVVMRLSFAGRGEVNRVASAFSRDGETFEEAGIGLPRGWRLFTSIVYEEDTTTVLVPVVARFGTGDFLFEESGTYYLRWGVRFKNEQTSGISIDHTVKVGAPRACDVGFLSRLSDSLFLHQLFGRDLFANSPEEFREWVHSGAGADYRALIVIAELLKATREEWVGSAVEGRHSEDELRKWGEALFALARDIPDSCYAPYAAYYAGCCYSTMSLNRAIETVRGRRTAGQPKDRGAEAEQLIDLAKKDRDCTQAYEAFAVAAERGDAYLKPRALYQKGVVCSFSGRWDEMERLLDEALENAPGRGTIYDMVSKVREDLAHAREKMEAKGTTEQP